MARPSADAGDVNEAQIADDGHPVVLHHPVRGAGRVLGLIAGLIAVVAGYALEEWLIAVVGMAAIIGALVARAVTTTVEDGVLLQRFHAAPLRGPSTRAMALDQIRGVEVLHEHDSDAAPARADSYWTAVRLIDRRRPIGLGARHYDRAPAEHEAAALRTALGLGAAADELTLTVPATAGERAVVLGGAAAAATTCGAMLLIAGGRPIELVWPLAALSLVAALATLALVAAAAFTGGTQVVVRPATGRITLTHGVGRIGRRSQVVPFEDIAGVVLTGEGTDGHGTVSLSVPRHAGPGPTLYRGPAASDQLAAVERALERTPRFGAPRRV